MNFEGHFEKRISIKKPDTEYEVLVIQTKDGKFKKDVYLKWGEKQLLEVLNERNQSDELKFPDLR